MRSPRAWSKMVGKRVKLLRAIRANGGWEFRKGTIVLIERVWKARFTLRRLRRPKEIHEEDGSITTPWSISNVERSAFEVLP